MEFSKRKFNQLPEQDGCGELTRKEFEDDVKHMKIGKVPDTDEIPAEVYKKSVVTKTILFVFLQKVWNKECVPVEEFAIRVFVILYKNR